jgi:site-specific DNA-methyltransferase (adenine-specific)
MIYAKKSGFFPQKVRYSQAFEYMLVFVKGQQSPTFNPITVPTKPHHTTKTSATRRNKDGTMSKRRVVHLKKQRPLTNIIEYDIGFCKTTPDRFAYEHPAMFPEKLAEDHILTWSNPGETVLDPMCGAGTVLKMAKKHARHYIGVDVSHRYCEISKQRVEKRNTQK